MYSSIGNSVGIDVHSDLSYSNQNWKDRWENIKNSTQCVRSCCGVDAYNVRII